MAFAAAGVSGEIVVLDNASHDGSADAVRGREHVVLIESDVNLGFAAAVNRCAAQARGRVLLLCNPDARVDPACLAALMRARGDDVAAGIWGGRIRTTSGEIDYATARRELGLLGLAAWATMIATVARRLGVELDVPRRVRRATQPIGVDMLSGVLLLVNAHTWAALGGFDERFFMYGEDADLCTRARSAGWRPTLVPDAVAEHELGASSSSTRREMLKLAGRCTYIDNNMVGPRRWLALRLVQLGVTVRSVAPSRSVDWRSVRRAADVWRYGYEREREARRSQLERLGVTSAA